MGLGWAAGDICLFHDLGASAAPADRSISAIFFARLLRSGCFPAYPANDGWPFIGFPILRGKPAWMIRPMLQLPCTGLCRYLPPPSVEPMLVLKKEEGSWMGSPRSAACQGPSVR